MKELEDKIADFIYAEGDTYGVARDAEKNIAKEIKDIAIEFAKFSERYIDEAFGTLIETEMKINYEGLFQDFLKQRYGKV